MFDRKRGRPIADGPRVNVTVHEGKSFAGEVQMNPEMVLRSPTPPTSGGSRQCVLQRFEPEEKASGTGEIPESMLARDRIQCMTVGRIVMQAGPPGKS